MFFYYPLNGYLCYNTGLLCKPIVKTARIACNPLCYNTNVNIFLAYPFGGFISDC